MDLPVSDRLAPPPPYPFLYQGLVSRALEEDLARAGDLTSDALIDIGNRAGGAIVTRAVGRVAGLDVALSAFRLLDGQVQVDARRADGSDVSAGQIVALVKGDTRALLSGERTALNFLGRLSGIATATRDVVSSLEGLKTRVCCTRKTTPGLRSLEKYAVRVGGGSNHRYGLDDAVLIKDNHLRMLGGLAEAVSRARRAVGHMVKVEVEVESLGQLEEALSLGVDAVLLDNMPLALLREAVSIVGGRALTEASGGITPANVREVAATGVDLISLGWLTHSAPCLDVAFDLPAA